MPMKLNLKTPVGVFQIEGATQMEVFKEVATIQEVFSEECCGLCQGDELQYVVREVGKYKFPEIHCQSQKCGARLSFGQNAGDKLGSLFPIRKLDKHQKPDRKSGEYGPHRGWTKYKGDPEPE